MISIHPLHLRSQCSLQHPLLIIPIIFLRYHLPSIVSCFLGGSSLVVSSVHVIDLLYDVPQDERLWACPGVQLVPDSVSSLAYSHRHPVPPPPDLPSLLRP